MGEGEVEGVGEGEEEREREKWGWLEKEERESVGGETDVRSCTLSDIPLFQNRHDYSFIIEESLELHILRLFLFHSNLSSKGLGLMFNQITWEFM